MSDIDPSRDGRRARGRLLPLPPEAPRRLWTLRLLQAARHTVLADDDHANEAHGVPSRKTTAPRRIPVAVPES
jgi:hypothetical protein